ncbi:FAD-dependent oxidoreductase [Nocardioides acrostichi]|uniref:FAD-binding protein n=1 Tax=Nocardioides acrostichi TaxID=2784339 RepID=A0A930USU0_9ACTN|nr:FAD-dependent oxidoreductase [Nocardioides acrostichi]MBF4160203.1 FAD-binding protein [Nocardioides acrostichi]
MPASAFTHPAPVEVDLIVVGSGGGAMTGALLAQRAGLSVVVLERTDRVGGTSAYSGGACWLPGSAVQQRAGIADSTEGARTYLEAVLQPDDGWTPDGAKVEAFLAHAPVVVAELEAAGIDFEWLPFPEYYDAPGRCPMGRSIQPTSIKRAALPRDVAAVVRPPVERDRVGEEGRNTLTGGQALIARLAAAFLGAGGQICTGHTVRDLLTETDVSGDKVVGVWALTEHGAVEVRARRGVLLGSGGFEGSEARRDSHDTPGRVEWSMAPRGTNRGEPISAALDAGAAVDWTGLGWFCPGLEQPDGGGSFTLGFRSGLMVDGSGRRYGNESLPYDQFGRLMAADPARIPSWFVFDSREGGRLPGIAMPEGDPAAHLEAGTWVRADTLEELAEQTGVPASALVTSVARFNGFCATGVDEDFGRGSDEYDTFFTAGEGPNKALTGVEQAPFYAARFVLSDLGTKGGVVTDTSGRALRPDGSAVPRLYACGNAAAPMTGPYYPGPGAPLGTAMVFASLAVRDLVD